MRIFELIFLQTRQKFAGILGVWQEFLTQYAAKFAEKTQADAYAHKLLQRTSRLFPLRGRFQPLHHCPAAATVSVVVSVSGAGVVCGSGTSGSGGSL